MNPNNTPGDALAERQFSLASGAAASPEAQAAEAQAASEQAQADAAAAMLKASVQTVLVGLLKTARTVIAKRLPEIREHWPDAVLHGPAEAALPLLDRHMATLMGLIGSSPELAAFAIACLPLGLGYMAAVDQHRRTIDMPASDQQPAAQA